MNMITLACPNKFIHFNYNLEVLSGNYPKMSYADQEKKETVTNRTVQVTHELSPVTLWNVANFLEKRSDLLFVRADVLRNQIQLTGYMQRFNQNAVNATLNSMGVEISEPYTHQVLMDRTANNCSRYRQQSIRSAYILIVLITISLINYFLPPTTWFNHQVFTGISLLLNFLLLSYSIPKLTRQLLIEIRCHYISRIPIPGPTGHLLLSIAGLFSIYLVHWHTPLPLYVETMGIYCWWLILSEYFSERRRYQVLTSLDAAGLNNPGLISESAVLAECDPLGYLQINQNMIRVGMPLATWIGFSAILWWWMYPDLFAHIAPWQQSLLFDTSHLSGWATGLWVAAGIWILAGIMMNTAPLAQTITELLQYRALDYGVVLPTDSHIALLFKMRVMCFLRHRVFITQDTHVAHFEGLNTVDQLDALSWARAITDSFQDLAGEDNDLRLALNACATRERAPVRVLFSSAKEDGLAFIAHNEDEGFMLARAPYLEKLGISLEVFKHQRYKLLQEGKTVLYLARGGRWDAHAEKLHNISRMTVFGLVAATHGIYQKAIPAMRILKRLQIETRLLSPDDSDRAKILAQQIGISAYQGKQLPVEIERTMKQFERNTVGTLGLVVHESEMPAKPLPADLTIIINTSQDDTSRIPENYSTDETSPTVNESSLPARIYRGGIESLIPVLMLVRAGEFAALRGLVFFILLWSAGLAGAFTGLIHPLIAVCWGLLAEWVLFRHTRAVDRFEYESSLKNLMSD